MIRALYVWAPFVGLEGFCWGVGLVCALKEQLYYTCGVGVTGFISMQTMTRQAGDSVESD